MHVQPCMEKTFIVFGRDIYEFGGLDRYRHAKQLMCSQQTD